VVAVLALVAAGVWFASRNPAIDSPSPSLSRPVRIAVLPFVNLTGDGSADYLADGLTDEVIAQLGQLSPRGLGVIARTSAMTYRNTAKTVSDIGRELNVTFVVESSLRREGDGVRIASRLVPVANQTPVAQWSEIFGSTAGNDSQTGAAIRLARLIALELAPDESAADRPRPTSDLMAWDGFLQGRAQLNRSTPDDVRGAIAQFEAAVERDPNFAGAWSKLAEARHMLVMMGALAPESAYPAARQATARAMAADSTLADAHLAQGLVQLWYDWNPAAAAKSFEKALALNASHAAAHHDYAWSLMALGRIPEAIAHITTARDLNPLSARANNDIGWLHLHLRQPADAARACEHTLAINANSLEAQACLERAHAQRGLYDAALRAARAGLPPGDRDRVSTDNRSASDTLRAVWQWRLERLEQASRTRWISPYTMAVHHVLLGNAERALDQLEAAFQHRAGMMVFVHKDPALDPLRDHPRFRMLVNRVNEGAR
jgi:TolB-like protein/Tfp pilus assembly protein PilF